MRIISITWLFLIACSGGQQGQENSQAAQSDTVARAEKIAGHTVSADTNIQVKSLVDGQEITSPLAIRGRARGYWFFEASFLIELQDEEGRVLGTALAEAQEDWMTEDFVPFVATLQFDNPVAEKGLLVFHKQNASGKPELQEAYTIAVSFR